jgi:hypothetical protein
MTKENKYTFFLHFLHLENNFGEDFLQVSVSGDGLDFS